MRKERIECIELGTLTASLPRFVAAALKKTYPSLLHSHSLHASETAAAIIHTSAGK